MLRIRRTVPATRCQAAGRSTLSGNFAVFFTTVLRTSSSFFLLHLQSMSVPPGDRAVVKTIRQGQYKLVNLIPHASIVCQCLFVGFCRCCQLDRIIKSDVYGFVFPGQYGQVSCAWLQSVIT